MAPPFLCALAVKVWQGRTGYHGTGVLTGCRATWFPAAQPATVDEARGHVATHKIDPLNLFLLGCTPLVGAGGGDADWSPQRFCSSWDCPLWTNRARAGDCRRLG